MGNITNITRGGSAYKTYTYDSLGELLSETQHSLNKKDSYGYDPLGNIRTRTTTNTSTNATTEKVTYNYGTDSSAGWKYMLTSITTEDYTSGTKVTTTETIDYDQIGNPLSYRGATMSWFGRQLRTYSKGSTTASFAYDADGLRSSKTVNGTKTEYQYVGDQLFYENRGNGNELYYFYDSYGNLSRIYHHNNGARVAYFVATNAQGDVIALYNASGVKVGAYDYDAWGNQRVFVVTQDASGANIHTQINPETQYLTHIVNLNPIRYRGYYFDRDLGLYYLQSRYYDASIGRFINADGYLTTGQGVLSYNMYAYCANNPVMYSDPSGRVSLLAIGLGILAVLAITAFDHYIASNYPEGVSLTPDYSTSWSTDNYSVQAKSNYAQGSGFSADDNGVTLFDTEVGIYRDTVTFNNGDQGSLIKFATAGAKAEADWSGIPAVEIGGYAAVYSANMENTIYCYFFDVVISTDLYVGSVSGSIAWDMNEGQFSVSPPTVGNGFKIGVDFEWK